MSNGQTQTSRPRVPMIPGPAGTAARQETAGLTNVTGGRSGGAVATTDQHVHAAPFVRIHGPTGKIAKAIANVMSRVGTIKKRGKNEFHGYNYATFDDLLYAVTPLMGEQGLAVAQNEIEIKQVDKSHVAVKYEFVVYHESGEALPPQVFTGMSLLLTRKGTYDDKAINKCHSAARKYFLLSLYQVPAGDFDDGDADEGDNANQRRVPGPAEDGKKEPARQTAAAAQDREGPPPPQEKTVPHKLNMSPGTTADQWAGAYIRAIGTATTPEQIAEWDKLNDDFLQRLSDRYSKVYEMIATAVERRLSDVGGSPMPDPKKDAQEAMNWIASQLQQMRTYEAAEAFWNTMVAPREKDFDQLDWEMLMGEWERVVVRLTPQDPGGPPADAQAGA